MRTVLFFLAVFLIIGCDNSEDFFLYQDSSPRVLIKREADTVFTTELNDSFKLSSHIYRVNVNYFSDQKISIVTTTNFKSDSVKVYNNNLAFVYFNNEGISQISFSASDCYNKKGIANLTVVTFKNLPPVAEVTVIKTAIHSPLEIEIDASASYDLDARFGGSIVEYEYKLNDLTQVSSHSTFPYIFGVSGQKQISVRVKDNDGAWSDEKTVYITL